MGIKIFPPVHDGRSQNVRAFPFSEPSREAERFLCLGWVNRRQGQCYFRIKLFKRGSIYPWWLSFVNGLNLVCAYVLQITLEIRVII